MSEVKVNKLSPRSGTTVTIGDSGDTINIVGTLQNNGAAIPGDISSVIAGTGLSGGGTSGDVTINIEAAQPTITSLGTITTFRSTGIDDNADALAMTIDSSEQIGIGTTSPQNTLHVVKSAISGVSYRTNAPLIVENNSSTEIQILSANSSDGQLRFGDADANFRGAITYAHADDTMSFATNGANQVKINSNGVMSVADGIALGVGLNNTSSNVLEDYEEGTFTPIYRTTGTQLSSVTYNSLTGGQYTKVGQLVTLTGAIASNAVTAGSPSGNLRLGGLPFTVRTVGSTTATRGAVAMSNQNLWSSNHTPNNGYVIENTTEIDLKMLYGNNENADALASTNILTGSNTSANRLFFTVSYMTDA